MGAPPIYDIRLKSFFRLMLVGPSGSGKTSWAMSLLQSLDQVLDRKPAKVIFYYNVWQNLYNDMENHIDEFRPGVPTRQEILALSSLSTQGGCLVIIDDQVQNVNKDLAEIFMVAGRHSGISLIFMSQNLFSKDPHFRNISLQSTYIVLLKNPRDGSSVSHLAKQLKPGNSKFLLDAYADATQTAYSYFFIDLHQETPELIRYRKNIFPRENPPIVYVPHL